MRGDRNLRRSTRSQQSIQRYQSSADYHRIDPEYRLEIEAIESGSVVLAVMGGIALLDVTVIAFNKLGIPPESSRADKKTRSR